MGLVGIISPVHPYTHIRLLHLPLPHTSPQSQRRLAWPLRKDDTHKSRRVRPFFFISFLESLLVYFKTNCCHEHRYCVLLVLYLFFLFPPCANPPPLGPKCLLRGYPILPAFCHDQMKREVFEGCLTPSVLRLW